MSACMYMGPKGREGKAGMEGCCHFAFDTITLYHGCINCKHLNLRKRSNSIETFKISLPVQGKTLKLRVTFQNIILMMQVDGRSTTVEDPPPPSSQRRATLPDRTADCDAPTERLEIVP